ncbi:MAG TPA: ABC transporter ATP-binding protein, partial [Chitinophagaceae bacterium]
DILSNPFKKLGQPSKQKFLALNDVNFEVMPGESIAIVGRNGAGKSTLLKVLSGITPPSSGRIISRGRIASLLEVGTGFHMELTGRENIFMNGSILGMRKHEIKKHFDAIVDFSGVEKFLDTPLKRYSSGMQLRLAFAVAAHLEPEILVIDEVLAVGDAEFQKKCLGKMDEVSKSGRTLLFVSHNMPAVQQLCTRGVFLDKGTVKQTGRIEDTVSLYLNNVNKNLTTWEATGKKNNEVYISKVEVEVRGSQPNPKLSVKVCLDANRDFPKSYLAFYIGSIDSVPLMEAIPRYEPFIEFPGAGKQAFINSEIDLPPMIPGLYTLGVWLGSGHMHTLDWPKDIVTFEIVESPMGGRTIDFPKHAGFLVANSQVNEINYSSL